MSFFSSKYRAVHVKIVNWIIFIVLFLLFYFAYKSYDHSLITKSEFIPVTEIEVIDGDTLKIKGRKYRLYGIDAPETRQEYGKESKRLVEVLLAESGKIQLYNVTMDKYGRLVSVIYMSDGTTLQAQMLNNGGAWYFDKYCRKLEFCPPFKSYEKSAREKGIGLWHSGTAVPPWEWRKTHKSRENKGE